MIVKLIRGVLWGVAFLFGFVCSLIVLGIIVAMLADWVSSPAPDRGIQWDPVTTFHYQPLLWLFILIPAAVFVLGFRFGLRRHRRLHGD